MFMRKMPLFLILALIAWQIPGCAVKSAIPTASKTTPTFVSPVSPIVTPLAGKVAPSSTPQVPDPEKGKGTIVGVLYDQRQGKPYAGQSIYLGKVNELKSADGSKPIPFVELNVKVDPHADTDANGHFVIQDVAPGRYALAVWRPDLQQRLLHDAAKNISIAVEVKPDEISDLGTLQIIEAQ
jgi:hypothetical protein